MNEIAKILKRFGPKYELNFTYDYFSSIPSLRMELRYYDQRLNEVIKIEHHIPLDEVHKYSEYGPRIIEDMQRKIQEQIHKLWGEFV